MEYTSRHNVNRGYMKLEVWQEAMGLVRITQALLEKEPGLDIRLRSQILDSVQSISANIAEGYCRRTVREYIQYIGIALGSAGELFTRIIGLKTVGKVSNGDFEHFDMLHFSVENKLLSLRRSLEQKKREGSWEEELREPATEYGGTKE